MGICKCKHCGIEFQKPNSEINRNAKLSRPNFCSRTCVGKNNVKNLLNVKNRYDISKHSGSRLDNYTKFRYHFRNIKSRNHIVTITIDDLKNQWDKQEGICPFSKIKLELSSYSKINKHPIYSASLDRIDSNLGYIKENIRWVSRAINLMKNNMDDELVWELINLLKENNKGTN
jgi:hypothetical protein